MDKVSWMYMRTLLNPHQKSQVAIAALKGDKTLTQLSGEYQVHPSQIEEWKDTLLKNAPQIFTDIKKNEQQKTIDTLHKIIGQRDEEIDWLKKKLPTLHP